MTPSEELDALLEALPDAAAVLGADGRVVRANAALQGLFSMSPAGRTLLELTRDQTAESAVKSAIEGNSAKAELTLPLSRRTLLINAAPFGRGALVVLRDVTDAKRMELARRDFVANASHELRTPVTAIFGAAETLLGGALEEPEAARGFVEMIARHAERLSRLTQDLLDLSRIESGEWTVRLVPLDVVGIAASTIELFRKRAEAKGLKLSHTVPPGTAVLGDRRALEQVLVNLVDNAIKYTVKGAVRIEAAREGAEVTLSVVDTGPGIDRHHLPRLFERFYRVDVGRSRAAGGTGLGLSIVKHLVQEQRGELGVDSGPDGSRFWVRLPAA